MPLFLPAIKGKSVEIDFGPLGVSEKSFTIVDPSVTMNSKIIGSIAYVAPTGKDLDENEMDALDLRFSASDGQVNIYIKGLEGYVADKFVVNYLVS